jgi:SAM-dependent methyltransferase
MQVVAVAERAAGYPDQVRQLFDAKAPAWPAKYAPGGRLAGRLVFLTARLHRHVPTAGRVLDLGCGTGELARGAAAAGMQVTACDISAEMLRRAADHDPGGAVGWVQLHPGWRELPLRAAAFDVVIAASVLEYVDDPSVVLGECARVLRPGGVLLCTVPNLAHPVRWLEWPAGLAARSPQIRSPDGRWPRFDSYLSYLRTSRQRRRPGWWSAAAARAGLLTVARSPHAAGLSPLRLLTFQRSADPSGGTS